MTTIIKITAIRPPKEGKKVATVVAATGQSFEAWPDLAAGLREGARYEVQLKERQWTPPSGGNTLTYRTITKAKEVMQTDQAPIRAQAPDARPRLGATAGADQEIAFVTSTLNAFIAAGQVKLDARELGQATQLLRMLWSHSFGPGLNTFHASEAGTRN